MEYKSNNNVVYSSKHHVVWRPKYRRPVLVKPVEARLKRILLETATEQRAEVLELEVMPDHVHLLLEVDPQYGIHVRRWKERSSHILRREFRSLATRLPTLWHLQEDRYLGNYQARWRRSASGRGRLGRR